MSLKKSTKRSLTSDMDGTVRQMMKLIEENGDSFAQKAEMYYQKRPELISLVEEFYRGYRSLAERYEHVTGELWKNIPSDLQSQTSDNGSEPTSSWPSPSPRKLGRRISSNRAAGFDFFLGTNGNNSNNYGYDSCQKDGDGCSTLMTDSDDEFDDASSNNSCSGFFVNSSDNGLNKKVVELEIELREVKEKLFIYEQEHGEDFGSKNNAYEQELRNLNEKLRLSEEEIQKMKIEVEKYKSLESTHLHDDDTNELLSSTEEDIKMVKEKVEDSDMHIASLKFEASNLAHKESIQNLQDQLNFSHKESSTWKMKFNSEKRDNTKLQERVSRLKTSLADREHEINDLKVVLSDTEQKSFFQRAQLKTEVSKLLTQKTHLEDKIKETQYEKSDMEEKLKCEIEILKKDIQDKKNNIEDLNMRLDDFNDEVENMNMQLDQLHMEHMKMSSGMEEALRHVVELESRVKELEDEIERQKIEILEGAEEKREAIRQLCFSLEHYRNGYNVLRQAFLDNKRSPILTS
ncbi:protein NETWORKED 4A [Cicer arietinum]|uniref:Protein NETWORKED 4A n=1 Tax=Cicer arietinum TaxID=3827 RepID=A0A1S2Y714_CICAR|nr:protein NETWORKED 4A [Cicer arietinum]